MTSERMKTLKTGRKIGALVGGILFVVFGIVPGFYFGSYATLVLLTHLTGGPLDPGIIVRILLVAGIVVGLFCVAAVSIVLGSLTGTVLAYVADALSDALKARPTVKEAESTVTNK